VVHLQEDEKEHVKTTKYFSEFLVERLQHFKGCYKLDAPNVPDDINFDDFMIYTRALKYFSNIINDICFPELDKLVLFAKNDALLEKRMSLFKNLKEDVAIEKKTRLLKGFFQQHFSLTDEELVNEFCNLYFSE